MILGDHAGHLVPQAHGLMWQQFGVQVPDDLAHHIVRGDGLCGGIFVQPRDGGKSSCMVLEGEWEPRCWLPPPRQGAGALGQPAVLELLFSTSSTCSAHDGPSPPPTVSIGAGREGVAVGALAGVSSMMADSTTGASATGASAIGVSTTAASLTGAAVSSALGLLELGT